MTKAPYRRKRTPVTQNGYAILMNVQRYLRKPKVACNANEELSPRELLSKVTGISLGISEKAIRMELN